MNKLGFFLDQKKKLFTLSLSNEEIDKITEKTTLLELFNNSTVIYESIIQKVERVLIKCKQNSNKFIYYDIKTDNFIVFSYNEEYSYFENNTLISNKIVKEIGINYSDYENMFNYTKKPIMLYTLREGTPIIEGDYITKLTRTIDVIDVINFSYFLGTNNIHLNSNLDLHIINIKNLKSILTNKFSNNFNFEYHQCNDDKNFFIFIFEAFHKPKLTKLGIFKNSSDSSVTISDAPKDEDEDEDEELVIEDEDKDEELVIEDEYEYDPNSEEGDTCLCDSMFDNSKCNYCKNIENLNDPINTSGIHVFINTAKETDISFEEENKKDKKYKEEKRKVKERERKEKTNEREFRKKEKKDRKQGKKQTVSRRSDIKFGTHRKNISKTRNLQKNKKHLENNQEEKSNIEDKNNLKSSENENETSSGDLLNNMITNQLLSALNSVSLDDYNKINEYTAKETLKFEHTSSNSDSFVNELDVEEPVKKNKILSEKPQETLIDEEFLKRIKLNLHNPSELRKIVDELKEKDDSINAKGMSVPFADLLMYHIGNDNISNIPNSNPVLGKPINIRNTNTNNDNDTTKFVDYEYLDNKLKSFEEKHEKPDKCIVRLKNIHNPHANNTHNNQQLKYHGKQPHGNILNSQTRIRESYKNKNAVDEANQRLNTLNIKLDDLADDKFEDIMDSTMAKWLYSKIDEDLVSHGQPTLSEFKIQMNERTNTINEAKLDDYGGINGKYCLYVKIEYNNGNEYIKIPLEKYSQNEFTMPTFFKINSNENDISGDNEIVKSSSSIMIKNYSHLREYICAWVKKSVPEVIPPMVKKVLGRFNDSADDYTTEFTIDDINNKKINELIVHIDINNPKFNEEKKDPFDQPIVFKMMGQEFKLEKNKPDHKAEFEGNLKINNNIISKQPFIIKNNTDYFNNFKDGYFL